jgi:hypothetical protein
METYRSLTGNANGKYETGIAEGEIRGYSFGLEELQ